MGFALELSEIDAESRARTRQVEAFEAAAAIYRRAEAHGRALSGRELVEFERQASKAARLGKGLAELPGGGGCSLVEAAFATSENQGFCERR